MFGSNGLRRRVVGVFVALFTVALSTGCLQRVSIPDPPAQDASIKEKKDYWRKYHATSATSRITASVSQSGHVNVSERVEYLQLADGQRVYHANDLAHVVDKNSPTGQSIERFNSANEWTGYWGIALLATVPVGGTLAMGMFVAGVVSEAVIPGSGTVVGVLPAVGTLLVGIPVGLLVTGIGYVWCRNTAKAERESAFMTYNDSLALKLGLEE